MAKKRKNKRRARSENAPTPNNSMMTAEAMPMKQMSAMDKMAAGMKQEQMGQGMMGNNMPPKPPKRKKRRK